ncbi:transcriptional regulator BetI [Mesorhizobium hawassense]|uniref:Transcriptional regulator BetI n=1 Tax=Mesorhizobium hawassense TaxID=1209954 RepID=A0A330HJC2_9HYPH|nr:transcriptional regulator BetI [Mesorhizobium hawassense]RAZ88811.1 transcriptional regulator BetI [Mesorhizobium hawassense]
MVKRSIKAMRRDELIDAAIAVVGEEGMSGATMAVIARRAGMSAGLVNHYFDSKEELMALAMRNLSNLFRQNIMRLAPTNPTPGQRLKAIVDGSFAQQHLGMPNRAVTWAQFMIAAQTEPRIKHLYHLTGARFVSNIRYAVKQLVPTDQVDDTVDGIAALIDGFFWQSVGEYEDEDLERAHRICWRYICLLIPGIDA